MTGVTKRELLPQHAELIARSAISDEVATARGYWTATTRGELEALGFRPYQAISPALVIPVYDVTGKIALYQIRPDCPRINKNGKAIKYETPFGTRMVVDVPPSTREKLRDPTVPLWCTEGIRKADAAVSKGLCCVALLGVFGWRGTNQEGGKAALPCWESIALNGRHVFLCFDSDVMTKKEVQNALHRFRAFLEQRGARVHVVYLPDGDDGSKIGLDDYLAARHTVDELRSLADAQTAPKPKEKAKPNTPPPPLAPLLASILAFLLRYIVFKSREQAIAITLWIVHTHIVQQFDATPYLHITSATKQAGKTRLLDVLALLVAKAWRVITPSEAVLYRKIALDCPTLMLDEVDAIYGPRAKEHEAVRALLNAGNRKDTKVPRCVGEGGNQRIEEFEVFCPKALAGIGNLPDTVADRSIRVRLTRRLRSESVARFYLRQAKSEASPIHEGLAAWAASTDLSEARPSAPESLSDRAQEAWEPLLAIADAAGGEWPASARKAAESLFRDGQEEDTDLGVQLLADLRSIFDSSGKDALWTEALITALNGLESAPWAERSNGKGLTANALARMLKAFDIRSGGSIRVGHETKKGYRRTQFLDAWERFLTTSPSSSPGAGTSGTPAHGANSTTCAGPNGNVTGTNGGTGTEFVNDFEGCAGVPDETPSGEEKVADTQEELF